MAGSKGSKYYDIFLDYSINLEHKSGGNGEVPKEGKQALPKMESV